MAWDTAEAFSGVDPSMGFEETLKYIIPDCQASAALGFGKAVIGASVSGWRGRAACLGVVNSYLWTRFLITANVNMAWGFTVSGHTWASRRQNKGKLQNNCVVVVYVSSTPLRLAFLFVVKVKLFSTETYHVEVQQIVLWREWLIGEIFRLQASLFIELNKLRKLAAFTCLQRLGHSLLSQTLSAKMNNSCASHVDCLCH